jgi:hypothetical protein
MPPMSNHQMVGIVLIVTGVLDALVSIWLPNRLPEGSQRTVVRLALLSSGIVVAALGGLFFAGMIGTGA